MRALPLPHTKQPTPWKRCFFHFQSRQFIRNVANSCLFGFRSLFYISPPFLQSRLIFILSRKQKRRPRDTKCVLMCRMNDWMNGDGPFEQVPKGVLIDMAAFHLPDLAMQLGVQPPEKAHSLPCFLTLSKIETRVMWLVGRSKWCLVLFHIRDSIQIQVCSTTKSRSLKVLSKHRFRFLLAGFGIDIGYEFAWVKDRMS